jgi:predicted dinucleotide-binding enzyme
VRFREGARWDGTAMDGTAPRLGVVGCGRMGTALAEVFAAAGFSTRLASRRPSAAAALAHRLPRSAAGTVEWVAGTADIIALATPPQAACADLASRINRLVIGKPLIDVSNPGFHRPGDDPYGVSAAERIAGAVPCGHVVKALNCVPAGKIEDLRRLAVTVPIAGNQMSAKVLVGSVLERLGFEVADAGPLSSSRWIEGLPHLLVRLAAQAGTDDPVGFRLVHPQKSMRSLLNRTNYENESEVREWQAR